MGQNFIRADRDQAMLMPPSLRDWVPDDHLAWFVIDAVEHMDLSGFYVRYRDDGWGRAAFEPKMMVALLLYAYARGVRSSREIERRLVEDVAFRVIAANHRPDHSTICRFRQANEQALNGLFVSVLGLCVKAELVDPKIIVIDGTKIAANASGANNITEDHLRDFGARVFEEAAAVDAAEDELYGDRRGDELPEHLKDKDKRVEWIRDQLAAQGAPLKGNKPARVNTTDPDSRPMKTPTGFVQGFNAQVAVTEDHLIVATDVTNQNADSPHFRPMVEQVIANLDAVGAEPAATVVADAGYFTNANASLDLGPDVFIAPVPSRTLRSPGFDPESTPNRSDEQWLRYEQAMKAINTEVERRVELIKRLLAGEVSTREVADKLCVTTDRVWQLKHAFLRHGRAGVMFKRGLPRPPRRPSEVRQRMLAKFATEEGRATYAVRARCAEPVIGQLKEVDGLRRFSRRGQQACFAEVRLQSTAHNLKKLWRRLQKGIGCGVATRCRCHAWAA